MNDTDFMLCGVVRPWHFTTFHLCQFLLIHFILLKELLIILLCTLLKTLDGEIHNGRIDGIRSGFQYGIG